MKKKKVDLKKHKEELERMSLFGSSRNFLNNVKTKAKPDTFVLNRRVFENKYPSNIDYLKNKLETKLPTVYEDDMAVREEIAQAEIERKKKYVGLAYNKGNYVYLGENPDPEIIKSLGRK